MTSAATVAAAAAAVALLVVAPAAVRNPCRVRTRARYDSIVWQQQCDSVYGNSLAGRGRSYWHVDI
jgi:hypothetical protein